MSPEFNLQGALQDRERGLLMRWLNMRFEGGNRWQIYALDTMISLSIPRFRSLGMEEESKFILGAFSDMKNHSILEVA